MSEELEGFTVGIIHEPGYCEVCHHRLRVGSHAAIWRPTKELFCVPCARQVATTRQHWTFAIPTVMLVVALFGAIVLGFVR